MTENTKRNTSLTALPLDEFSGQLYAKVSVPGGGGAAAYIGALAVSLGAMAGNFTTGKIKFAAYEEDLARMLADAEALRQRFLILVDEDAAAFAPLSAAYGIPKGDPSREETLRQATLAAIRPPYEMLESCCRTIELLEEMAGKCSRLMISDVGCGAAAAKASLEAAYLNVLINTRTLREDAQAQAYASGAARMYEEYLPRAQAVYEAVLRTLQE